jgi:O-succinylbenzoic acid--CoA ligase
METAMLNDADIWSAEKCHVMVNDRDVRAVAESELIRPWVESKAELDGHLLFATSGSMGRRKWVALSRDALMASARAVNHHLGVTKKDRWLLALPRFHVGGLGILVRCDLAGCAVVEYAQHWDAPRYCAFLERECITLSSLVPTQLVDLVRSGCAAPDDLRVVLIGGGRLDDGVYQQAMDLGWPVVETYGMTETCSQVATALPGSGRRSLNCLPIWETRIDERSRLWLKGEALLTGYISVHGHEVVMKDPKQNGWFLSGDVAVIDGEYLQIQGRSDRCVKVLGELVSLDEVEREWQRFLATAHVGDMECAVISEEDVRRGATLWLCVEGRELDSDVLVRWNARCNPLYRMSGIRHYDRFPRSALGKILYGRLV